MDVQAARGTSKLAISTSFSLLLHVVFLAYVARLATLPVAPLPDIFLAPMSAVTGTSSDGSEPGGGLDASANPDAAPPAGGAPELPPRTSDSVSAVHEHVPPRRQAVRQFADVSRDRLPAAPKPRVASPPSLSRPVRDPVEKVIPRPRAIPREDVAKRPQIPSPVVARKETAPQQVPPPVSALRLSSEAAIRWDAELPPKMDVANTTKAAPVLPPSAPLRPASQPPSEPHELGLSAAASATAPAAMDAAPLMAEPPPIPAVPEVSKPAFEASPMAAQRQTAATVADSPTAPPVAMLPEPPATPTLFVPASPAPNVQDRPAAPSGKKGPREIAVPGVEHEAKKPPLRDTGSSVVPREPARATMTSPGSLTVPVAPPDAAGADAPRGDTAAPGKRGVEALGPPVPAPPASGAPQSGEGTATGTEPGPPGTPERRAAAGLGLDPLRIQLDGAAQRSTSKEFESVSGVVLGSSEVQATIQINERRQPLALDGGRFQLDVPLQRGANRVHVVVTDAQGRSAESTIAIQYQPPPVPNGIAIVAPADGATLASDDAPVVMVRGRVENRDVSVVSLLVNQLRFDVSVRNGTFEQPVPVVEGTVKILAEARREGSESRRSVPVTIHAAPDAPPTAVIFLGWASPGPRETPRLRATWRGRPETLNGPNGAVTVRAIPAPAESATRLYYVRGLKPGAYTFALESGVSQGGIPMSSRLFVPVAGATAMRQMKQLRPSASGHVTVARILLPFGVSWDDDEWFSGRSEGSDTITKFNTDGISWLERRRDLP